MDYFEKTLSVEKVYNGNIINVEKITIELPNGKIATRDVVRHPGAAVVVPLDSEGYVYMVRQYRKPLEKESLEFPAGKLDKGEAPLNCAIRELREETGLNAEEMKFMVSIDSTPGFSDEILHMYIATGLTAGETCPDEDELVSTEKHKVSELVSMVMKGEITDAKTIIGILIADKLTV